MISGAGIFPCPSCGEMIYSDVKSCRFCSAPVDAEAAARGAYLQKQVNNACNQAKMLRHSAVSMWVLLLVAFVPVFGPALWGFHGLMVVIPVWLIYWQVTFGKLESGDPDFKRARRDRRMALIIWAPSLLVFLLIGIPRITGQ